MSVVEMPSDKYKTGGGKHELMLQTDLRKGTLAEKRLTFATFFLGAI